MKKRFPALLAALVVCVSAFTPCRAQAAVFHTNRTITSRAVELVNLDTGAVVYEKNPNEKHEPASTTKIMTYIVVAEHVKDLQGTRVTIKQSVLDQLLGTGSSMSGIEGGDVATIYQLLNCMMVPSGNDAALVLADYVGGGNVGKFVEMMNAKAKELGCANTHFTNPHGLHDANHYTTAADLAKISHYAMSLPFFMDICSQTGYDYKPLGGPRAGKSIPLYTTNLMMLSNDADYYYKYAKGIKTGHTDESGYCLVSSASADGYSYLSVVLGAPSVDQNGNEIDTHQEMLDTANLFRWALTSLKLKEVVSANDTLGEIDLKYAWNKDKLQLRAEKSCSAILPEDVSTSSVIVTKNVPKSIEAPVRKGQVVGTATVSYANEKLATVNLVAAESVERSELLHTTDTVKSVLTSKWFLIIVAVIILLVIVYIILAIIYNRKRRNLRRVKRYRKM